MTRPTVSGGGEDILGCGKAAIHPAPMDCALEYLVIL